MSNEGLAYELVTKDEETRQCSRVESRSKCESDADISNEIKSGLGSGRESDTEAYLR